MGALGSGRAPWRALSHLTYCALHLATCVYFWHYMSGAVYSTPGALRLAACALHLRLALRWTSCLVYCRVFASVLLPVVSSQLSFNFCYVLPCVAPGPVMRLLFRFAVRLELSSSEIAQAVTHLAAVSCLVYVSRSGP